MRRFPLVPLVLGIALAVSLTTPALAGPSADPAPGPGIGPDARLRAAAAVNGMSATRLERLLERDPAARLDRGGRLFYRDTAKAGAAGGAESGGPTTSARAVPAAPFPYAETFTLHSRPGSNRTIYLDFDGHSVVDTAWNDQAGVQARNYPGLSLDASATFSDAERDIVQDVWLRVSEDFAPYDVDVTTQDPGRAGLTRDSSGDQVFGVRALVTPVNWCGGGCLGVAYVDVFDKVSSTGYFQPAWAFSDEVDNDPIQIAETITHEVGHTLALNHDGQNSGSAYYVGHGIWSPVMGAAYGALTQFSKGEYVDPDNLQDDLAVMAKSGIAYRQDDHTVPTGAPLSRAVTGVIGRRTDTDTFAVTQGCAGPFTATASPAPRGPNLDIRLTLRSADGSLVSSNDPPSGRGANDFEAVGLDAQVTSSNLPAGSYTLEIDGVGAGNPRSTGYSDYGSIGGYSLDVDASCAVAAAPTQLNSLTGSATPTSVTATWRPPTSNGGSAVTGYLLTFGGTTVSLAADAREHTFTGLAPGTDYALRVHAVNAVGAGPERAISVRTPATRPGAARIRDAVAGSPGGKVTAKARWRAPLESGGSTRTRYKLRALRVDSSGDVVGRKTVTVDPDRRKKVVKLAPGRYVFRVRAVNAVGAGPWSPKSNRVRAR
ncbi:fibronectin type III domain-containing protein [Nocardioides donggukensis]|uniref:Fibronectin type III domain-containing protein n=1 Tax=Nocardioides donggukensis TaxID=2774019 RepID=A0A927Q2R0_9ACTN|nr:fibronectin type III domain-containing protein [Nocardioides donggukensis]MBD8870629.1 fibronectin type III domain-containing protein [Nocardioides donggukensis]